MTQPSARLAGSTQILQFIGTVTVDVATAAYPKAQSSYPSDAAIDGVTPTCARFLLADATDVTDDAKRFPPFVFDDTQPAGAAPHAPVAGTGILNVTDLDISARTWCQNTRVIVQPRDAATAAALASIQAEGAKVCLDIGADSGLGTDTGLPVLCLAFVFAAAPLVASLDLDILIEVRKSSVR